MDGLSAGTAAVAAAALFAAAVLSGRHESATLLAGLCGACLGFLRLNFEPARIYMGDAGSLLLGLLLGALAMNNGYTENNRLAALAPGLILGVPLFDMLFVMYVRRRRGLPVMLGSPDHVALRLRKWRLYDPANRAGLVRGDRRPRRRGHRHEPRRPHRSRLDSRRDPGRGAGPRIPAPPRGHEPVRRA